MSISTSVKYTAVSDFILLKGSQSRILKLDELYTLVGVALSLKTSHNPVSDCIRCNAKESAWCYLLYVLHLFKIQIMLQLPYSLFQD